MHPQSLGPVPVRAFYSIDGSTVDKAVGYIIQLGSPLLESCFRRHGCVRRRHLRGLGQCYQIFVVLAKICP